MTKPTKYLAGRNSSMPELRLALLSRDTDLIERDLRFLNKNGFISPKYFHKQTKSKKIKKFKQNRASIPKLHYDDNEGLFLSNPNLDEKLKSSLNHYKEFQDFFAPKQSLNHLCPLPTPKAKIVSSDLVPSLSPKQLYSVYKNESMDLLKQVDTRIKKAKEYLVIAKNISRRYN